MEDAEEVEIESAGGGTDCCNAASVRSVAFGAGAGAADGVEAVGAVMVDAVDASLNCT